MQPHIYPIKTVHLEGNHIMKCAFQSCWATGTVRMHTRNRFRWMNLQSPTEQDTITKGEVNFPVYSEPHKLKHAGY